MVQDTWVSSNPPSLHPSHKALEWYDKAQKGAALLRPPAGLSAKALPVRQADLATEDGELAAPPPKL